MNISQITNYNLVSAADIDPPYVINIEGKDHTVTYKQYHFPTSAGVKKFGYCCENRAMPYPIYIKTTTDNDRQQEFFITVTGMFEVQPEKFKDITDEESEEETIEVYITDVQVPQFDEDSERRDPPDNEYGFIFKLDFAY